MLAAANMYNLGASMSACVFAVHGPSTHFQERSTPTKIPFAPADIV